MRLKAVSQNLALVLASTLIGLAGFEALVRVLYPEYNPSHQVRFVDAADGTLIGSPGRTFRHSISTGEYDVEVKFNELGFRDPKTLNMSVTESIFVLGDSFSFGWGVEEPNRYSDRLSRLLAQPVFNISIPTDFDGYAALLRRARENGAKVGLLIVGVCMENDLRMYAAAALPARAPSSPVALPSSEMIKQWLREHFSAYFFVARAVRGHPRLATTASRLGLLRGNLDWVSEADLSDQVLESSANRLVDLVRGSRAVILVIPSRLLWVGDQASQRAHARAHQRFVAILRLRGLIVVDVREQFEQEGTPLKYHFGHDGHWNTAGHRIAAERLAETIRRLPKY